MKPTVGRIVHFHEINEQGASGPPRAAIITEVWSDTCVNLAIFYGNGSPVTTPPTSVMLVPAGDPAPSGVRHYCQWPSPV